MIQQIKLLLQLQIRESYGFNEARYSKDTKKRRRIYLLAGTFVFLALIIMFYISALTFGFMSLGLGRVLPEYLYTITSLIIFFFSIFKAGEMIFNIQSYERLISLPIMPSAIISSRFIHMYLSNAVMAYIVMLPSTLIYGILSKQSAFFFIFMAVSTFFIPLLPMTVATVFGALILSISSRMKHKKTVSITLSFMFVMVAVLLPGYISSNVSNFSQTQFSDLALLISASIKRLYPPAALYSAAAAGDALLPFLAFTVASLIIFSLFVMLTKSRFTVICSALNATAARRSFVMSVQTQSSPLAALFRKELKRYFSSTIYVMNTAIGYVMMLLLVVFGAVSGADKLQLLLSLPFDIIKLIPYLLAACCIISPPTTSAISLEGNRWWIVKSLPVTTKNVFDSKILVTLTVAAPFYFISALLGCIFLAKDAASALEFIFVPAVYILFSAVTGLAVNAKMPLMNWESETVAVKQGGAVLVFMLIGIISIVVPIAVILTAPATVAAFVTPVYMLLLLAVTAIIYRAGNKLSLISIA